MGRGIIAFAQLGRTSSSDALISGSTSSRVGVGEGLGAGGQVFRMVKLHQGNGRRNRASCLNFFICVAFYVWNMIVVSLFFVTMWLFFHSELNYLQ